MMNRLVRFLILLISAVGVVAAIAWVRPVPSPAASPGTPTELDRIYAPFDTLRTDLSDYRWPVPGPLATTSVFGDYRSTHFHGGIDVSTQGREGVPVRAMRDGWVSLVRVSPHGYGNVVELTHEDGFTTWYAHLRNFAPHLDSLIRRRQEESSTYSAELRFDGREIAVARDETIALSGSTGAGGPHLHFEIRDAERNPVNPLLAPDLADHARDRVAPAFDEFGVLPLTAGTLVQGNSRPVYVRPQYNGGGVYRIAPSFRLTGDVGFTVRVRDGVGVRAYRNRMASLELKVDGATVYESTIARLPADDSKQIAIHFDWAARANGHPYHQKLFVDRGNRLPFYARLPQGSGMLRSTDFAEGPHQLEITARDLNGNESRLRASVIFNHLPRLDAVPPGRDTSANPTDWLSVEPEFYRDFVYVHIRSPRPLPSKPSIRIMAEGEVPDPQVHSLSSRSFFATFPLSSELGRSVTIEAIANGLTTSLRGTHEMLFTPVTTRDGGTTELADGSFRLSFPPSGVLSDIYLRLHEDNGAVRALPDDAVLDQGARVEMAVPADLLSRRAGLFLSEDGDLQLLDWREPFGRMRLEGRVTRFLGTFRVLEDETPPRLERRSLSYRSAALSMEFRIRDDRSGVASSTIRVTVDDKPVLAVYDPDRRCITVAERIELSRGRHRIEIQARDRMDNRAVWRGSIVRK